MSFAAPPNNTQVSNTSPGGIASKFSHRITPGDSLSFFVPYGQFILDPADQRPQLFIATGIGIAPIRAQLMADHSNQPTTLIFGTLAPQKRFLDQKFLNLSQ